MEETLKNPTRPRAEKNYPASPVGISDFERIVGEGYYYIDKTLLAREIWEAGQIILITRPRRFGKTLNMDMLRCFFEKRSKSRRHLFENLEIGQHPEYMALQGTFPVIWLSFKDIEAGDWESCFKAVKWRVREEYKRHEPELSGALDDYYQKQFRSILDDTGDEVDFESSIQWLSKFLSDVSGKRALVLIDEYDIPIQTAQKNGYYDRAVSFFRNMLARALKDNPCVEKGVLTGVLRIARESLFSGLNNLDVFSILDEKFSDKFGFTDSEVDRTLAYFGLGDRKDTVERWYDGYSMAGTRVYNPWSIINFLEKRKTKPYWINTSDNALVYDLIQRAEPVIQRKWEALLSGRAIRGVIDENIVFSNLHDSVDALWTVLFFSGYLTVESAVDESLHEYRLKLPNLEVKECFKSSVQRWIRSAGGADHLDRLPEALADGDGETFRKSLQNLAETVLSFHDMGGDEPERVWHVFVLGMLVRLEKTHRIRSNRESGLGRYDIMLIPRRPEGPGVVLEFKKLRKNEEPKRALQRAFEQMDEKKYAAELDDFNAGRKIAFAVAARGKRVWVDKREWGGEAVWG
ncbi:conserved hypothetical protein [Candidatus Desulfarcum epimagneticum]|uniref:AAA-ATPase-like domain-containing protein n=1 Tax=uncultured Desulfobacteraceae bacterium TaxID=218296 RepID=A0A484HJP5_9BACT|nr:conserved hypothetical protein [uncultured Desulfobacteraceae bacterium]